MRTVRSLIIVVLLAHGTTTACASGPNGAAPSTQNSRTTSTAVVIEIVSGQSGSSSSSAGAQPSSTGTFLGPPIFGPLPCDDHAACALGFTLDGSVYTVGCTTILDRFVTDEVIATGELNGRSRSVRRIAGVDASVLVAIDYPSGLCAGDASDSRGRWSVVFSPHAEDGEGLRAVCAVGALTDAQRVINGCSTTG